jgi:small subunit ribosomal protein S9
MKVIQTSGRRKLAVGHAVLKEGKGLVTINGKDLSKLTPKYVRLKIQEPLIIAGKEVDKINISVKVAGGGSSGQAEAARLVIARALVTYKEGLREAFLNYDRNLLVADVRYKESRKPNTHGKARAKRQKSYR